MYTVHTSKYLAMTETGFVCVSFSSSIFYSFDRKVVLRHIRNQGYLFHCFLFISIVQRNSNSEITVHNVHLRIKYVEWKIVLDRPRNIHKSLGI